MPHAVDRCMPSPDLHKLRTPKYPLQTCKGNVFIRTYAATDFGYNYSSRSNFLPETVFVFVFGYRFLLKHAFSVCVCVCVCVCVRACVRACVCVCVWRDVNVGVLMYLLFIFLLLYAAYLALSSSSIGQVHRKCPLLLLFRCIVNVLYYYYYYYYYY